jgi:hypothetical protein
MKALMFIPFLMLASCGKYELAPEVININGTLRPGLKSLLEMALEEEICHKVEREGFDCNIQEQMRFITFTWVHNPKKITEYDLEFCLKHACPAEVLE